MVGRILHILIDNARLGIVEELVGQHVREYLHTGDTELSTIIIYDVLRSKLRKGKPLGTTEIFHLVALILQQCTLRQLCEVVARQETFACHIAVRIELVFFAVLALVLAKQHVAEILAALLFHVGLLLLLRVFSVDAVVDDYAGFLYLSLCQLVERTPTVESMIEVVLVISQYIVHPTVSKPIRTLLFQAAFKEGVVHNLGEYLFYLLFTLGRKYEKSTHLVA